MPRFVLLYHDCPPEYERPSHWDFMLESGDVLRTWALERLPRDWNLVWSRTAASFPHCPLLADENRVLAVPLGDHRREYLEFEGKLSGDRGNVVHVLAGSYRSDTETSDCLCATLESAELAGRTCLSRQTASSARWTLEWAPVD